jgi:hypothetical protein
MSNEPLPVPQTPTFAVLRGAPSPEQLAALTAVLHLQAAVQAAVDPDSAATRPSPAWRSLPYANPRAWQNG